LERSTWVPAGSAPAESARSGDDPAPADNLTSSSHAPGHRAYWLCQFGGWGAYGLVQIYAGITSLDAPWVRIVLEVLALHAGGLALTHGLRAYGLRHHWNALRIPQLVWRILLAGALLALPLAFASSLMAVGDMHDSGNASAHYSLIEGFHPFTLLRFSLQCANWLAVFVGWLLIYYFAIRSRERRYAELRQSELARALQSAELRLLKSQLNPHFLFNSLNSIRTLIVCDPARARDAVTRLATLLRYTLNASQEELVTLGQELEIINDYLTLESMRFEDRLRVDIDVPAALRGIRIPVMLLQTVVENAIKHGIAELPSGGILQVRAALDKDTLAITVTNPMPTRRLRAPGGGVGLRNSAERLRLLFGTEGALELDLSGSGSATARIRIPSAIKRLESPDMSFESSR
jgi:Histidine kinase